jgi:hypothetical protein
MNDTPDLLLVADRHDHLAQRFGTLATKAGKRVSQMNGISAARLFTIRVEPQMTTVTPSLPMFVRSSAWWRESPGEDEDEDFLRAEAYATFWAAASLSSAPVINRPGRHGTSTYLTSGEIASIFGNRFSSSVKEFHVSSSTFVRDPEHVWGEDTHYLAAPLSTFSKESCIRARRIGEAPLYEIITVVAGESFAATNDSRTRQFSLGERSSAMARELGLEFATITWSIEGGDVIAVRVNSSPEEHEVRYAWSDIATALYRKLLS